jgi:hypothetical protein
MVFHRTNLSKDEPEGLVEEGAFEVCGVANRPKSQADSIGARTADRSTPKRGDSAGIEAGEVKDMLFADFDPSDPTSCFVHRMNGIFFASKRGLR